MFRFFNDHLIRLQPRNDALKRSSNSSHADDYVWLQRTCGNEEEDRAEVLFSLEPLHATMGQTYNMFRIFDKAAFGAFFIRLHNIINKKCLVLHRRNAFIEFSCTKRQITVL